MGFDEFSDVASGAAKATAAARKEKVFKKRKRRVKLTPEEEARIMAEQQALLQADKEHMAHLSTSDVGSGLHAPA